MKRFVFGVAVLALAACNGSQAPSPAMPYAARSFEGTTANTTRVFVRGRDIFIATGSAAATPAFLKGVDYAPTPICSKYIETPLGVANAAIWRRDLPLFRQLNINAIKVYNSNANGNITAFLNAAYNKGNKPVYTILSIRFNADIPLNSGAVADLSAQYKKLAQTNGANPDVIGISIGSEVNAEDYIGNPQWWSGMSALATAAKDGLRAAGAGSKIITTTFVDDGFNSEREGEKNHFPVDAWGINFYRGPTFGVAFNEYKKVSSKPLIVSEWGTPYSWHPTNTWNNVQNVPAAKASLFTTYVTGLAGELYKNATSKGGVASGGFYFEYTDEWYKGGGDGCAHVAGPQAKPNPKFPGGWNDEGWYGLNAIATGAPNVLTQRPTYTALKKVWASQ
jgi:hypothetical protein